MARRPSSSGSPTVTWSCLAAAVVQDQRGLQDELVDDGGAGVGARGQGELGQGGAGHDDRAEDRVVGQPGLGVLGQAAGEQPFVAVADPDRGGQQGVVEPGPARRRRGRLVPVRATSQYRWRWKA